MVLSPNRHEYVVVARRYRPQTLEQLVGQEHVSRALAGAIASDRVGHAYLFTGARGVGKTSTARILAKALNCAKGPTATPCNECDPCQRISTGDDVDVLEIDGASNRGIDEIRELRANVLVRPSRSRFKIYIIDEVHMLTREAFNALLKTLEEPPEHVKFIFCTTEVEKIPVTILSRCQRFDFAGIAAAQVAERLTEIAAAEGVEIEQAAIVLLARRGGGSMRDSQSLLEQLLSFGSESIRVADVHALMGTAADERLGDLVAPILASDAAAALAALDQALAEGVDVGRLLEQLLGYFRDVMAAAVGCEPAAFLHVSPVEYPRVAAAASQWGVATVMAALQIVDHTLGRLRYSSQGRTLAELAVVRLANLEQLEPLSELLARLRQGVLEGPAPVRAIPSRGTSHAVSPQPRARNENVAAGPAVPIQATSTTNIADESAETTATLPHDVPAPWVEVIARLRPDLASCAEQATGIRQPDEGTVVVAFPATESFCKTLCQKNVAEFQRVWHEVADRTVRFDFVVAAESEAEASERPARRSRAEIEKEKTDHPLVQRTVERFNARPIRVELPAG